MCYLGGIWRRLEQLEGIYGRFLLVDPRAASLECPTFRREHRLHKNPENGHKSARGPHRRDVRHILRKLSCFFIEILSFS